MVTAAKLLLSSESPRAQLARVTEPEGRRGPHGGPRPRPLLAVRHPPAPSTPGSSMEKELTVESAWQPSTLLPHPPGARPDSQVLR